MRSREEIEKEMRKASAELATIVYYVNGSISERPRKYTSKDGSESEQKALPTLQYYAGGRQGGKRVPRKLLPAMRQRVANGRRRKELPRTARNARCARRGGASWIANVVGNGFHANVDGEHPDDDDFFMNDFFHAAEHLHALVAELVRKPEDAAAQFERLKDLMWSKGAERACKDVVKTFGLPKKGTEARKQYDYLWERRRFMRYDEFRELQLFIGTGVMEAACRTDVARRCKQSGMHWRVFNASAMCALVARIRTQRKAA